MYGNSTAGELLSAFGRLFTFCTQKYSHTCVMEDLLLTREAEQSRLDELQTGVLSGINCAKDFTRVSASETINEQQLSAKLEKRLNENEDSEMLLDSNMQGVTSQITSAIIAKCLPIGQRKTFPTNCFSLMVNAGAKGSLVNHSQISALLGQQSLEGRRVPRIKASGKTLPCFFKFDPTARAGGYISQRFLTGLKPQEYYFHCMAGREGLVDTAVKTSRSGYLQRCLIKGLELLSVQYDGTIRNDDGGVVQFQYGEDGIDTLKTAFLDGNRKTLQFLYDNATPITTSFNIGYAPGMLNLDQEEEEEEKEEEIEESQKSFDLKRPIELFAHIKKMRKVVEDFTLYCDLVSDFEHFSQTNSFKKLRESTEAEYEFMLKLLETAGLEESAAVKVVIPLVDSSKVVEATVLKLHRSELPRLTFKQFQDSSTFKTFLQQLETPRVDVQIGTAPMRTLDVWSLRAAPKKSAEQLLTVFQVVPYVPDPVSNLMYGKAENSLGILSEALNDKLNSFLQHHAGTLRNHEDSEADDSFLSVSSDDDNELVLRQLLSVKYKKSEVPIGENVGVIAAQGIGEPSTQMTLNTFHLAGHGGGNVTLGIPRMRELLMSASKKLKTPSMTLPLFNTTQPSRIDYNPELEAQRIQAQLTKIFLSDLVRSKAGIEVLERVVFNGELGCREYKVILHFEPLTLIYEKFGLLLSQIVEVVGNRFCSRFLKLLTNDLRRSGDLISKKDAKPLRDDFDGEDAEDLGFGKEEKPIAKTKAERNLDDQDSNVDSGEESEESAEELEAEHEVKKSQGTSDEEVSDSDSDEESTETSEPHLKKGMEKKLTARRKSSGGRKGGAFAASGSARKKPLQLEHLVNIVEEAVANNPFFVRCSYRDELPEAKLSACCEVILRAPAETRRLLMAGIAEVALNRTIVRQVSGITNSYVNVKKQNSANDSKVELIVDGCNLKAAWQLDDLVVDLTRIRCNDVHAVLETYGVEACRNCIVQEIKAVFGVYGIDVDYRHMSLVADAMTYEGTYQGFNRREMQTRTLSEILKMSFEQSGMFIKESASLGMTDHLKSASARIATGQLFKHGTGSFDVLIQQPQSSS